MSDNEVNKPTPNELTPSQKKELLAKIIEELVDGSPDTRQKIVDRFANEERKKQGKPPLK
jgi:hypothetical protein